MSVIAIGRRRMDQITRTYEQMIDRFVKWAKTEQGIRAAIVVGSRARIDRAADEWADLDIMIFTTQPEHYIPRTDWLENIGNVWISIVGRTAGGDPERLVLFEDGFKVDFVFLSTDALRRLVDAESVPALYARGARVILDKDGLAVQAIPSSFGSPASHLPTQEEFLHVINAFWYTAVVVAEQLRRGELWLVKIRDASMKECLLYILQWHARATHGWDCDTWHMGRFMEHWADPRALKEMHDVFARFDEADSWRALLATMDLFRWLAIETSEQLGYRYPTFADERATELVGNLFSGSSRTDNH
jgi:aminoglycoside 6-adenylyltransferase